MTSSDQGEELPLSAAKRLFFTSILLLGVYGFVELSAVAGLWVVTGRLFSPSRGQQERRAVLSAEEAGAGMREDAPLEPGETVGGQPHQGTYLHPYLGYDNGRQDLEPRVRSADRLLVGVLGGSFAAAFATSLTLERELEKIPAFEGREIVVLKLAVGGYKQPQQLMNLNYLFARGGELDVAVNLDGHNEVASHRLGNALTGVATVYPRNWYSRVRSLPLPELRRLVGQVTFLEGERVEIAQRFSAGPTWSPSWNLIWHLRDRSIATGIAVAQESYQSFRPRELTREITGPAKDYANDGEMYDDLVGIWARSSVQMHRLATANGAIYLHFIQPNQYVPNSKPMGREERARAFHPNHRRRADIENAYPRLRREAERLRALGVPVFDLTMVFEDIEDQVYIDPCCHISRFGYEIIAPRVASEIAAAWHRPERHARTPDAAGHTGASWAGVMPPASTSLLNPDQKAGARAR